MQNRFYKLLNRTWFGKSKNKTKNNSNNSKNIDKVNYKRNKYSVKQIGREIVLKPNTYNFGLKV